MINDSVLFIKSQQTGLLLNTTKNTNLQFKQKPVKAQNNTLVVLA